VLTTQRALRLSPLPSVSPFVRPSRARLAHSLPVHVTVSPALSPRNLHDAVNARISSMLRRSRLLCPVRVRTQLQRKRCGNHKKKKRERLRQSVRVGADHQPQSPRTDAHAGTRQRRRQQARMRPRQRSSSCLRMRVSSSIRPCHPQAREVLVFYKATTMPSRARTGHEHGKGRGCLLGCTLRSKLMSSVMALSIFRSSLDLRSSRISRAICRACARVVARELEGERARVCAWTGARGRPGASMGGS